MGRRSGFRRRTCRGCNRMRRRRGMWRRIRSSGLLRRHNRDRLRRGRRRGIQRLGWGSAIYCGVFLAGVGCLAVRPRRPVPVSRAHLRRPAQPCPAAWDPAPRHSCGPPPPGRWRACRPVPVSRAASRRSRARQRGARLRDTLAVRPRRGGGELAGRFLFLEHAYAGRRSRARQRGTRLPGRHDTLAGELARLGGRGNRWKAVILGREQSLVGNCRPLILGLRR